MGRRELAAAVTALALAGCGGQPRHPETEAPELALDLVDGATLALSGKPVANDASALHAALPSSEAGPVVLRVRARTMPDNATIVRVLRATKSSGVSLVRFDLAELRQDVAVDEALWASRLDQVVIARALSDGISLGVMQQTKAAWTDWGRAKIGDPTAENQARRALHEACTKTTCFVRLDIQSNANVLDALRQWQRLDGRLGLYVTVSLLEPEQPLTRFEGGPFAGTTVSGRLPPELIQGIVRHGFGRFRVCYEQGLARDANLRGKIVTRFVIGRDGTVSNVSDAGSDLPDMAVRECVLNQFKTFTFPRPDGGIVTVVYPIMLAPG